MRHILGKWLKRISNLSLASLYGASIAVAGIAPLFWTSGATAYSTDDPWSCSTAYTYTFSSTQFSWSNPTGGQNGANTNWTGTQGTSPVVVSTTGTGGPGSEKQVVTVVAYWGDHGPGTDKWYYKDSQNNWQLIDADFDTKKVTDVHWDYGHFVGNYQYTTNVYVPITNPTKPTGPSSNWSINVNTNYNFVALQTKYDSHSYHTVNPVINSVSNKNGSDYLTSIKVCATLKTTQLPAPTIVCSATASIPNFTQEWTQVSGAIGYGYSTTYDSGAKNYADTSLSHDSSITYDLISNPNHVLRTNNTDTPQATYIWQVKALGNGTTTLDSAWSTPCTTTYTAPAVNHAPTTPVLESPQTIAYRHSSNNNYSTWLPSTDPDAGDTVTYRYQSSFSDQTNVDGSFASIAYDTNDHGGNLTATQIQNGGPNGLEPEGTYYWHVQAIDNHGLASGWATPWEIVVDNTPPTITVKTDSTYTTGNLAAKDFSKVSFSLFDQNNIKYATLNGHVINLTPNKWSDINYVGIYGWFGEVEGNNQLVVYDLAGNSSAYEFTIDTTAPEAPTPSIPDGTVVTSGSTVTLTTNDPQAKIYYTLDGSTPTDSSLLYTGAVSLTSLPVTLKAVAYDLAGNFSTVTTATYIAGGSGSGGNNLQGGDSQTPVPTPNVQPAGNGNANNQAVLGAQTITPNVSTPENTDTNTGDTGVLGTQTNTSNTKKKNGLAWYWWVLIALAAIGLGWFFAWWRRRSDEDEVEN